MAVIQKREAMDDDKRTKCGPAFGRRKHEITANYPILPRNTPSNRPDVPPARRVPNTQYVFLRGRKRGVLNQRDYLVWDIVWPAALQATYTSPRSREAGEVGHYRYRFAGSRRAEEEVGSILFLSPSDCSPISGFVIDYYTGRLLRSLSLILGSLSPFIKPELVIWDKGYGLNGS